MLLEYMQFISRAGYLACLHPELTKSFGQGWTVLLLLHLGMDIAPGLTRNLPKDLDQGWAVTLRPHLEISLDLGLVDRLP